MIDFTGRRADGPNDLADGPIFQRATGWLIEIGAKDVLPAVEMGVRFMHVGDTAAVWSTSKYAYGPGRRKSDSGSKDEDLLPHSNVRYDISLLRIVEMSDPAAQLQLCQSRKAIGNDIYRFECIQDDEYAKSRALSLYQRAAQTLAELVQKKDDTVAAEATKALMDCLNNIAAVHLSCKSFHAAKQACVRVLEMDPNNATALTRAAKAALEDSASSYEEVDAAIAAADDVGADTSKLKRLLQQRRAAHAKQTKKMFSSMAKGMIQQKKSDTSTAGEAEQPSEEHGISDQFQTDVSTSYASFFVLAMVAILALALAVWMLTARGPNVPDF